MHRPSSLILWCLKKYSEFQKWIHIKMSHLETFGRPILKYQRLSPVYWRKISTLLFKSFNCLLFQLLILWILISRAPIVLTYLYCSFSCTSKTEIIQLFRENSRVKMVSRLQHKLAEALSFRLGCKSSHFSSFSHLLQPNKFSKVQTAP